jgi:CubicO group peptidase (beta-lactamase class C family)
MRRILAFSFAILTVAVGFGQTPHVSAPRASQSQIRSELDQKIPGWLKQYDVPSVAVAYIRNGKIDWTAVYGEQSPGVPANANTLYNIASLTKPISAEVILRLASKGVISLDEPISAYWIDPDVKDNPWNALLTPRLCLSHQTGFANWRRQTNNVLTFQWQPGTRTGYSGEGYGYVARFAEKKTGQPFETLAQTYVFDPMGMKDTAYTTRDWYQGRLALGHTAKGEVDSETPSNFVAADLLRTTIHDYATFVVGVMHNQGLTKPIADQRLVLTRDQVSPEQKAKFCPMTKSATPNCELIVGMGLGWQVMDIDGEKIIDHSGSDDGAHSLVFYLPARQFGAVLFTNGENGSKVIHEIVGILYPNQVFLATQ